MTDLSPQAQEVFWAFNRAASGKPYDWHYLPAIAAALRAAADQVVTPEQERLFNEERPWDVELAGVVDVREQILAIADELEAQ